jgi:transaldolase
VATIPYTVMEQLVQYPLTDIGVEKFLADWKKVPKK